MGLLQRLYPLLKGAAEFQLATLVQDPNSGFMVTNPSISPENTHPHGSSVVAGPAMDNQLLRDLFANAAEAAHELRTDRPFQRACLAMRDRLPPDKIGALILSALSNPDLGGPAPPWTRGVAWRRGRCAARPAPGGTGRSRRYPMKRSASDCLCDKHRPTP